MPSFSQLVLVVEDDAIIAWDIAMQLKDLGYQTAGPAKTGELAIEIASRLRPTLVLMDIHLASAMDGISAAQTIRSQFDIPSIFVSAFNGDASRERAMLAKPAGYLTKPFSEHQLSAALEEAFRSL